MTYVTNSPTTACCGSAVGHCVCPPAQPVDNFDPDDILDIPEIDYTENAAPGLVAENAAENGDRDYLDIAEIDYSR